MSEKRLKAVCKNPFKYIEIHPDGNVYPCCPDWCNKHSIGNIYEEQDFEKIWNSEKAIEFRKAMLDEKYSMCNLDYCGFNCKNKYEIPEGCEPVMKTYPKYVKFCHDKQCNVRCVTCRDKQCYTSKEQTEKLNSLIEPLFLPMLKDCKVVILNGSGEVFASKHCRTLVKAIVEKYPDIKFGIHSNGLFFDKKNCDELGIIDKIDYAEISIHAATKKTYDEIVRDSDFDKVMNNAKWLADLKKQGKINKLILDYVVWSKNYKEMKAFQKMANKLEANTFFTGFRPWGSALAKDYEKVAVFESFHPKYNDFAKIVQDKIFKSPNCFMQNSFKTLKPKKRPFWHNGNIDDFELAFLINLKNKIFKNNPLMLTKKEQKYFQKNKAEEFQKMFVKDLNKRHKIKGKTICEFGSDLNLETAKLMLAYGAKHVICANPDFPNELKSPDKRITLIKDFGENVDTKNKKFDIVFGIAILEHAYDVKALFEKARDIIKPDGFIYFQGCPFYCSFFGHHVFIMDEKGKHIYTFDGRNGSINPFEPWEHLIYQTKEEYKECLLKKGFSESDANLIVKQLFCGHITKYRTKDIIDTIKSVEGLATEFSFWKEFEHAPNEFFKKALEKYTQDELLIRGMTVYARKTRK